MGKVIILLLLLLPFAAQAEAPECPIFATKKECLKSVMENYEGLIDFINRELPSEQEPEMIQAVNDIKRYESFACQKTCF